MATSAAAPEAWPVMAQDRNATSRNGEIKISADSNPVLAMPGHLIRRLQQISFALFIDQAKAFEMTPVQYASIVAINNHPGIDQTALCNIVALDRSTVGDVVGRLEKKKLIKRLNGSVDRRTKSLYITSAGRKLIRDIEPAVQSTQRLILAPLKSSERTVFMRMLKELVHLNNEHSRAPLRLTDMRLQRRGASADRA
jgi:MarR family transcriptional regulator, lower aerobic nicotinate degradation pathway regulator